MEDAACWLTIHSHRHLPNVALMLLPCCQEAQELSSPHQTAANGLNHVSPGHMGTDDTLLSTELTIGCKVKRSAS